MMDFVTSAGFEHGKRRELVEMHGIAERPHLTAVHTTDLGITKKIIVIQKHISGGLWGHSVIKTNTSPLANASFFQIGRVRVDICSPGA